MTSIRNSRRLSGRTILVSPGEVQSQHSIELVNQGARVLARPTLELGEPENYEALDEAIENLFGYDWLIFQNENAVDFFLRRFQMLSHEISELDALRVCSVGQEAAQRLELAPVHIDVIQDPPSSRALFEAIETYIGGREALAVLNFLVPTMAIARNGLQQMLEEAGARVDTVAAYRTVATNDPALAQLNALLTGGGIDCIVFNSSVEVRDFVNLFGSCDMAQILAEATVACADASTSQAAVDFGLHADLTAANPGVLAETICRHFGSS